MTRAIKQIVQALVPDKIGWIIILLSSFVLLTGITSELYLGDEIYHYRFAKDIFNAGRRVAFDPLFGKDWFSQQTYYLIPPLWHILLAFVWKITGGISFLVAQVYQTAYYAILLLLTYLSAKEVYGKEEGFYAMVLAGTAPMIVSFGILFYVDVPVTTAILLTFYLILRQKYLFAGFTFGLGYFLKFNAVVFVLPFLLIISLLNPEEKWFRKILLFCLAAAIIIIPDLYWREVNALPNAPSGTLLKIIRTFLFSSSVHLKSWIETTPGNGASRIYWGFGNNSNFSNIVDNVKYFGLPLLSALLLYILRKRFEKKDLLLWAPTITYLLFFIIFFNVDGDIRYLLPVCPFLAMIISKEIVSWRKKSLKILLLAVCVGQFASVLTYVHLQRKIPADIRQAIQFIKSNTPERSIIMYPEYNLTEYTNRRIYWTFRVKDIFWGDERSVMNLMQEYGIDYIMIKKARVYDDSGRRDLKGYPASFVSRLKTFPFLELQFENKDVSLWGFRAGIK